MSQLRLDKFLADAGIGTRSEVRALLKKKYVSVNDTVVTAPEFKVDPDQDRIFYRGTPLSYSRFHYYLMNKPAGVITATEDSRIPTVMDLFKDLPGRGLFPVGRLDRDTEGLLLITDNGDLAHKLLSPKKHVDKTYFARVEGNMTDDLIPVFAGGIDIGDDTPSLPAKLEILSSGEISEILLTIQEGRFHQVKRMVAAVGGNVIYLKRLSMGPLRLDEAMRPGEIRPLTAEELAALNC